jgi:putative transposase
MPFYFPRPTRPTFVHLARSFGGGDAPGLDVLTDAHLRQACDDLAVDFAPGDECVWTPALTLWALLHQAVSASKSCVAAVARAGALRVALGLPDCSSNTGAYCKARAKLPEALLPRLARDAGSRLDGLAPAHWLWQGRRVRVIDGTTVTAADTPANQRAYPQRDHLPGGVGFPLVRWVALFGLATGACLDAAAGPYAGKGAGETTLARGLLANLRAGDVLLGDRLFATYWLIAWTLSRGADGLFRLHAHRDREGRRGAGRLEGRQGPGDNLLVWVRPQRPAWMDRETYDSMPAELRVRVAWYRVATPGFRVREVTLVTTMLDAGRHPVEGLATLYGRRWDVELNVRALKQTMRMEHLTSKTPEMLRKELWAHLLGYNLIRSVQARAALEHGKTPDRLSFAAAMQQLEARRDLLMSTQGEDRRAVLRGLWRAVARRTVGNRPGRVEPRQVKRGPKAYTKLRMPRRRAIAELLRAWEEEAAAEATRELEAASRAAQGAAPPG